MTSVDTIPTVTHIDTSIIAERDDAKYRIQRRKVVDADAHKHVSNKRQYKREADVYAYSYMNPLALQVAPKWRKNQEDYINPHLLPHERDPIAPRYGADAVCRRLRATPDDLKLRCSCEYCVPAGHLRIQDRREINLALRKVVAAPGSRRSFQGKSVHGAWADWDWRDQDDNSDEDRTQDYQVDKRTPEPTVDLLSIAKPAKGRKRTSRSAPVALSRTRTLASARSFLEPVASGSGVLPEIDEISILDYEETWEHLDLDRLDLGVADGERSSEWDWERFSQF